uniref:DUF2339 domain-containing protein n=1 Tax=Ningiella ruwaisensis TaxID=2364274 RepID=UPI00109F5D29|nr:DUF2339 domain-containing protein [Ningiella ruwaisensis]
MDGLVVFGALLIIAMIAGAILGFVNLSQISALKRQISQLKEAVDQQARNISALRQGSADSLHREPPVQHKPVQREPVQPEPVHQQKNTENPKIKPENIPASKQADERFSLERFLMGNGLLWLGALVLALGGVFLAKYSIEAGLFPPGLRIGLGAVFGLSLIIVAEYLYRNPEKYQINTPVISAALASGGIITCYAMTLVAFDYYAFLSPGLAFAILASISLAGAGLSIRLGPILAGIGIIGAYAVPAIVSTGSNNVLALLLYVAAVSFSSIWIYQQVRRIWVWYLSAFGHFVWYAVAISISTDLPFILGDLKASSTPYLVSEYANIGILTVFGLFSIYVFALFDLLGWSLKECVRQPFTTKEMLIPRKEQLGVLLPLLGLVVYATLSGFSPELLYAFAAYSTLLLVMPLRHSALDTWPFLSLALAIFVFLKMPVTFDYSDNLFPFSGGFIFIQALSLVLIVYALFMQKSFSQRHAYSLLLVLAPLSLFAIAYALSAPEAAVFLYPVFAIELGIIATGFVLMAMRSATATSDTGQSLSHNSELVHKVSYLLLANGALALILTMLLSASTLTLALAAQITLMASLGAKYRLQLPPWLFKIAVIGVMVRLTFAPWLPDYAGETLFGLHWSIVIYPLSFILLLFARKHTRSNAHNKNLAAWFDGALLHLLALFVTTESSYLLIGEYPDFDNLSFQQSALLGMNYLILATVYFWRSQLTTQKALYRFFAVGLVLGAIYTHLFSSLLNNPFISNQEVGTNPIVNWLLILWFIPALVLLFNVKMQFFNKDTSKPALIVAGLFYVSYLNAAIRLFFEEGTSLYLYAVSQAELYTYSVIYLLIAIICIVIAQSKHLHRLNQLGFAILALVILKAFVIDMANLEGLYRALSFIGLGLSLVGIGWLFQRFKRLEKPCEPVT